MFYAAVVSLALVMATGATGATHVAPKPSWTCIRGVCLGTSMALMDYRYGPTWDWEVPVAGGVVQASPVSMKCRTTNRLMMIGTSDPIVRFPDRVQIGTTIPFGTTWRGYHFFQHGEGGTGWRKQVRAASGAKVTADAFTYRGKVTGVSLYLGWGRPCAS